MWPTALIYIICKVVEISAEAPNITNRSHESGERRNSACRRRMLRFNRDTDYVSWQQQMTLCNKLRDYKSAERPRNENGGPAVVTTHLDIASIGALQEALMEFTVQFKFHQHWYDSRLACHKDEHKKGKRYEYIHIAHDQLVWMPDTFFQNEKSGSNHFIDKPNYSIRVRYDGRVEYSRRLTMTFSCLMDFKRYPRDTQECQLDFASYAYTTKDIDYLWENTPVTIHPQATSFMLKFRLANYDNQSCTSTTNTGTYACLRVQFYFERVFSHYFLKLYMPSIMLVAVSYVSYWIDWKAAPGRVPLSMLTILGMIVQANIINANLPPVSYIKAIDLYVTTCLTLAFGSLLEYAFVNYTGVRDQRRKNPKNTGDAIMSQTQAIIQPQVITSSATPGRIDVWQPVVNHWGRSTETALTEFHVSVPINSQRQHQAYLTTNHQQIRLSKHNHPDAGYGTFVDNEMLPAMVLSSNVNTYMRQRRRNELDDEEAPPPLVEHYRRRRQRNVLSLFTTLRRKTMAERIDYFARILLPVLFVGFNVVYWIIFW